MLPSAAGRHEIPRNRTTSGLPVRPPVEPMLARLARVLPVGVYTYEPKWDGFRCLAFRDGDHVDLRSRHDRPLARYFPELVEALHGLPHERFVLDGEILIETEDGFDFPALLARLHPAASRVARLRRETPATFVAFDVLARGSEDLRGVPFEVRRARLEDLLVPEVVPSIRLTPITADPIVARSWLERFEGGGVDGVVAKHAGSEYRPGARAMVKVKRERTADCVVGGFRWRVDRPVVSSLLLGLYDAAGALHHIGMATAFTASRRRELLEELSPCRAPLAGHPWEQGFLTGGSPLGRLRGAPGRWVPEMGQDWVPLRPDLVCEVAYDQVDEGRFRHAARFVRWRPDREARSCTVDQLEAEPLSLDEVLG